MNKRRANNENAEQPPPRDYSEVLEVARMLYAVKPFPVKKSEWRWKRLVREAFTFLDYLREAGEQVAAERDKLLSAERSEKIEALPVSADGFVKFNEAVKIMTGQANIGRANLIFEKVVLAHPRYFGGIGFKAVMPTEERLRAQIEQWRKKGFRLDEANELQRLCDNAWPHIRAKEQRERLAKANRARASKRKQWNGERVSTKLHENRDSRALDEELKRKGFTLR
jgi:hypothetical protein